MKYVVLILLSFLSFPVLAEMPVEVVATSPDPIGKQLVYAFKEKIQQSKSMKISLDDSEARMQARMVTVDQNPGSPGMSTVYSLVVTWNNPEMPFPFYVTQITGYCGASRIDTCANIMIAELSEQSDKMIRLFIRATKR